MSRTRIPIICSSLVLGALALGACAVRPDAAAESSAPTAAVTLQRSTCFGNCAGYSVTLAPDGKVNFVGHAHVETMQAEARATPAQATAIMDAIKHSGLRTMKDSYASRDDGCEMIMTDQPSVKITVADAAGSKTVDFYYGCQGAAADAVKTKLNQLAKTIDEQLDTARWIGTPAAPGAAGKAER